MDKPEPVQLQLALPYKFEPREDGRVRDYIAKGYRIVQMQRISDREALVTLAVRNPGDGV